MSQENVEVVRNVMALMERGERGERNLRLLDHFTPDVEIDMSRRTFNPDVYLGHDGLRRLSREVRAVWDVFVVTPERFIDAGERVVTDAGRAAASRLRTDPP